MFHYELHPHRCQVVAPHSCMGQTTASDVASKGNKTRSILMTQSANMGVKKRRRRLQQELRVPCLHYRSGGSYFAECGLGMYPVSAASDVSCAERE